MFPIDVEEQTVKNRQKQALIGKARYLEILQKLGLSRGQCTLE